MRKNANKVYITAIVFGSLFCSMIIGAFMSHYYAKTQYQILSNVAEILISKYPDQEQAVIAQIKARGATQSSLKKGINYLENYGFTYGDFERPFQNVALMGAILGVSALLGLLILFIYTLSHKRKLRLEEIIGYLEKVNIGREVSIIQETEDDFSPLRDEIYKTVTELRNAKETAVKERKDFADNLANIAHQIKTPVTSISVMAQLSEQNMEKEHIAQIKKQADRLTLLVDALLTLSKIDAGVLKLKKEQVDVYSLLELSVEVMDEMIREKSIEIDIPNYEEVSFTGDMDWGIEAFINIIKNCVEHTPEGGKITFDYGVNPLYTEITVTDNGTGFSEIELPHIFKRFYQGKKAVKNGVGIGLSLAKSIIEMQNGFIIAKNLPEGGACFSVRFYSH
jgi:signal transduction histidine kinase